MRRGILTLSLIIAALIAATAPAEARGIRIPICRGDRVIRVARLDGMTDDDGRKVDLGYYFRGCTAVGWTAYPPRWGEFPRRWSEDYVQSLVRRGVIAEIPPAPGLAWAILTHATTFWGEWGTAIIGFLFGSMSLVMWWVKGRDYDIDIDPAMLGVARVRDHKRGVWVEPSGEAPKRPPQPVQAPRPQSGGNLLGASFGKRSLAGR